MTPSAPDTAPPALPSPIRMLLLCGVAIGTLSFTTVGPAMCVPAIAREMNLDYGRQGLLLSAAMWPFALAMVAAATADRIGFRVPFVAGVVLQVSGWFLLAQVRTFPQALGALALLGAGGATVDALVTPIVCAAYPERRSRMSNLLHAFYPLGLVLTAAAVLCLQLSDVHWRWIFRILGLACLPVGLATLLLALPSQAHEGTSRQAARGLLRRPAFLLLMLAMVLAGATEMGPANWLPTFIRELPAAVQNSPGQQLAAGLGLALFGALMAAGRLLASGLSARLGERRLMIAAAALCTACLLTAALPLPRGLIIAALATAGLGVACIWPTLLGLAGDRFPRAGASMFSSLSTCGAMGCAIAPALMGWIAEATGRLAPAMAALAAAPAMIMLILGWIPRSGNGGR